MSSIFNSKILQFFIRPRRRQRHATSNLESLRRDIETDVHLRAALDLLQSLETDATHGLSTTVARDLLKEHGLNALTPLKKTSNVFKFLGRCFGGFSLLIWVNSINTETQYTKVTREV